MDIIITLLPAIQVLLLALHILFVVLVDLLFSIDLVFVTGPPGPRNTRAPGPIPRPAPLNGPGRGVLFYSSLPLPPAPPVPQTGPR